VQAAIAARADVNRGAVIEYGGFEMPWGEEVPTYTVTGFTPLGARDAYTLRVALTVGRLEPPTPAHR
jgi:hypothetical protein